MVPLIFQDYIFDDCYELNARDNSGVKSRPSVFTETEENQLLENIINNTPLIENLRYWITPIKITILSAQKQFTKAESLLG